MVEEERNAVKSSNIAYGHIIVAVIAISSIYIKCFPR